MAAHNPAHIIFTGRNVASANDLIAQASAGAKLTFIACNTADNASVASAAQTILTTTPDRLDVLVCCAGIMGKAADVSKDGYEIQFAVNQLGHSILVRKLMPLLEKTAALPGADARVVMVTSTAWKNAPTGGIQFERLHTEQDILVGGPWRRYGQSKLANLLYARELADRYPNVLALAIHPGVVKTALITDLKWSQKLMVYFLYIGQMLTPTQGTYNLLWAITTRKDDIKTGGFYVPVGKLSGEETETSEYRDLGKKLWDWTEAEIARYL